MHRRAAVLLVATVAALVLAGCTSAAELVRAAGTDQAAACVQVSTPYGAVSWARANAPGTTVTAESGRCVVRQQAAPPAE